MDLRVKYLGQGSKNRVRSVWRKILFVLTVGQAQVRVHPEVVSAVVAPLQRAWFSLSVIVLSVHR